MECCL